MHQEILHMEILFRVFGALAVFLLLFVIVRKAMIGTPAQSRTDEVLDEVEDLHGEISDLEQNQEETVAGLKIAKEEALEPLKKKSEDIDALEGVDEVAAGWNDAMGKKEKRERRPPILLKPKPVRSGAVARSAQPRPPAEIDFDDDDDDDDGDW